MGCIYESHSEGCTLYCKDIENICWGNDGFCVCSDDPDPADSCEDYQSDYQCHGCGADMNIEDCTCDD